MNTRPSLWLTALAAFAGGFVSGLLVAPETRRYLVRGARDSTRWMEAHLHALDERLGAIEHQIHEASAHLGERVREITSTTLDHYVPTMPEDDASWAMERDDVAHDLPRLPRQ